MTGARTICVFTGSRADYGLLRWTMERIREEPALRLQVLVSGAHLSDAHGATWRDIRNDGFSIDASVPIDLSHDAPLALAAAAGRGMAEMAAAIEHLKPDLLVVLGDRYEAFTAAAAAMLLRLPIAHIHGGELTEGAMDDAIRHAITKMAHLHFPAAEAYRRRIIQMGEAPDRVFTVGALGLEAITRTHLMTRADLAGDLGFDLNAPVLLATYHPETLATEAAETTVDNLIAALDEIQDCRIVITMANADIDGHRVNRRLHAFAEARPGRVYMTANLGTRRYFSLVAIAKAVIGNSSSGIIEAPSLGTPTVNIGDRQKGRLRAPSVIDSDGSREDIRRAIATALDDAMQKIAAARANPYGSGDSSRHIVARLAGVDLAGLRTKMFHDLPMEGCA